MAAHQFARFGQILGTLHEAERDPVASMLHREAQIASILVGERGYGDHDVGDINALAVGQRAANLDNGVDAIGRHLLNPKHQLAIVQQQPRSRFERGVDFRMRQVHARRVAGRQVAVQREGRPGFQHRKAAFEGPDPQLWPLKIAQDRRWPAEFLFQRADRRDPLRMIFMRAVAHVDAESVGSGDEQRADHVRRIARRA
jgi:hypothetical protein